MACSYSVWVSIAAPRSHGILTKNPTARGGTTSHELLFRETSEVPKAIQTIYTAVGCHQNLMVKISLWKTTYVLDTGQKNQAAIGQLILELLPWWLACIVLEGAIRFLGGGDRLRSLHAVLQTGHNQLPLFHQRAHLAGQFVASYARSSACSPLEGNHFLIGFDSYWTAGNPCLVL